MRLNKYLAMHTNISRREADLLISNQQVKVNGNFAIIGQQIELTDQITIKDIQVSKVTDFTYLMLNKPMGFVCSRRGQGAPTIYELLPEKYKLLKTVGRLDKNSSGLIILTNDGDFSHHMTHPSFYKTKQYKIKLDRLLNVKDKVNIERGVTLEDGPSRLQFVDYDKSQNQYLVKMHEGRNRQIRRTFAALNYSVTELCRIQFGAYWLNKLESGKFKEVTKQDDNQ